METNLEYYRIFYNVAKCGSITLAAKQLFISQPAVSQSVKLLEKRINCKLFVRTQKGVKLTPEGKTLYKYVSEGYEKILLGEKKLHEMLNFENGEIRIGASDMTIRYYLLPYIEKFHRNYPGIKITISNAPTPNTISSLKEGKIDFGIISSPIEESRHYKVIPVSEISDIFIAGRRFEWLSKKIVPIEELGKLPVICLEENTSTRKYIDKFMLDNNVVLKPEFELATSDLIVKFAEMDMGIGCVVEKFALESLKDGRLFRLKLSKEMPPRKICVILGEQNPISRAGQELLKSII